MQRSSPTLSLGVYTKYFILSCFKRFYYSYYTESLYLVSFTYAFCMLIIAFMLGDHFKKNKYIDFFCNISLSVYLMQMTFGGLMMHEFSIMGVDFTLSFILTSVFIFLISWLHYRFIEVKILGKMFQ